MWPPKRPSAFMGNSRFTRAPSRSLENEVRVHVSGARSAPKVFGLMSSAVRQTPLTATLSPTPNCFGMVAASMVMRRFSPRCSIFTTLPTSSIIPVNIGLYLTLPKRLVESRASPPILPLYNSFPRCWRSRLYRVRVVEIAFQRKVFAETMQLGPLHALCLPVQSFTGNKGNCALAKKLRGVVEKHFVHFARCQGRSVHERSNFDQQAGDFEFAQALDDGGEVGASVRICRGYLLH